MRSNTRCLQDPPNLMITDACWPVQALIQKKGKEDVQNHFWDFAVTWPWTCMSFLDGGQHKVNVGLIRPQSHRPRDWSLTPVIMEICIPQLVGKNLLGTALDASSHCYTNQKHRLLFHSTSCNFWKLLASMLRHNLKAHEHYPSLMRVCTKISIFHANCRWLWQPASDQNNRKEVFGAALRFTGTTC